MPKPFRTMLLNDQAVHLIRSAASLRKIRPILMAIAFMSAVAAQVPDSNAIMGFENPNGWIVRGVLTTTATSTTVRTQGNYALAVKDGFLLTTLTSLPVASTATALTGIGVSGASFEVDLLAAGRPGRMHHCRTKDRNDIETTRQHFDRDEML